MTTISETRSTDYRLPLWLRLTALAVEQAEIDVLGAHQATFAPGELRELLTTDTALTPSAITRAIRLAEDHGMLAKGSSARCLRVIPGSLTTGPSR